MAISLTPDVDKQHVTGALETIENAINQYTVSAIATTPYHFALADAATYKQYTGSGAATWTIDQDSTTNMPIGTWIELENNASAAVSLTIAAGSGVTLNNAGALAQHKRGELVKTAANTWSLAIFS